MAVGHLENGEFISNIVGYLGMFGQGMTPLITFVTKVAQLVKERGIDERFSG